MISKQNLIALFKPNKIGIKFLRGDLFGGITTGVVALPLALGFGVASGLPDGAKAGMYSAIILGMIAAIFGGTKQQVSGPTGPMTVVAAGFIALSGKPEYIFAAVCLGGIFQILFGIMSLGNYVRYVPRTVISGFMTGIGVIIFLIQLQPIFGLPAVSGTIEALTMLPHAIANINPHAFLLGLGTLLVIYLLPKLSKAIPATLFALVLGTIVSEKYGLSVSKIGALPDGLPQFSLLIPSADMMPHVILAAITLAILGSLDSLLGSVVVDNITKTRHDSNKELVGQGLGNTVAGLFGALPGAGATMRTLLNIRTGGVTALSGVTHSILLLGVLLGLSKYASLIPLPVLAGILVSVGISIIDYPALKILNKSPKTDRITFIIVLSLTVFVDLITAVQMGLLVGSVLFMKNLSDRELTHTGSLGPMVLDKGRAKQLAETVRVIQANGPIFFGTSESIINELDVDTANTRAIIFRMSRVPLIDQTGAYTLLEFFKQMGDEKNITVVLSGLPEEPTKVLRNLNIIPDVIPENHVYATLAEAVVGLNGLLHIDADEMLEPQPYLHKVGG